MQETDRKWTQSNWLQNGPLILMDDTHDALENLMKEKRTKSHFSIEPHSHEGFFPKNRWTQLFLCICLREKTNDLRRHSISSYSESTGGWKPAVYVFL